MGKYKYNNFYFIAFSVLRYLRFSFTVLSHNAVKAFELAYVPAHLHSAVYNELFPLVSNYYFYIECIYFHNHRW